MSAEIPRVPRGGGIFMGADSRGGIFKGTQAPRVGAAQHPSDSSSCLPGEPCVLPSCTFLPPGSPCFESTLSPPPPVEILPSPKIQAQMCGDLPDPLLTFRVKVTQESGKLFSEFGAKIPACVVPCGGPFLGGSPAHTQFREHSLVSRKCCQPPGLPPGLPTVTML